MRDPFTWSLPLGRLFGITVRAHVLFPLVVLGLILRAATQKDSLPDTYLDVAMLMGLLFASVLAHEFGHCFAARWVDGDAHEVLLWPLGGLAAVEVPHTPRANFITAAAGPAVNLLLFLGTGLLLVAAMNFEVRPPWNPLWKPYRSELTGAVAKVVLTEWSGELVAVNSLGAVVLARLCWINGVLFLFNMCLVGFPMDAGRMLQAVLWTRVSYRQATMAAVFAGFLTALLLLIVSFVINDVLCLALAAFIYITCRQQLIILETGGEESLFGYDFSQGYTSLERDQPPPKRQPNWWQRWLQRRAARKLQREQETREAEDQRLDELLQKVKRLGRTALNDEERRFLKRVSERYRNRP